MNYLFKGNKDFNQDFHNWAVLCSENDQIGILHENFDLKMNLYYSDHPRIVFRVGLINRSVISIRWLVMQSASLRVRQKGGRPSSCAKSKGSTSLLTTVEQA